MKTLRVPDLSAPVEPAPFVFRPSARLVPFSVTCHRCAAELLVDEDGDLVYKANHVGYANQTDFELMVVCPVDLALIGVESYSAPGNPARLTPASNWREEIPLALRSRAYKAWENDPSKSRSYWQWFFARPEVRGWGASNARAFRKWMARLCPTFSVADLRAAGLSEEELVLANANGFIGLAPRVADWTGTFDELVVWCREAAAAVADLPVVERRRLLSEAKKFKPSLVLR